MADTTWQESYVANLHTMITALDEHVTKEDAVRILLEQASELMSDQAAQSISAVDVNRLAQYLYEEGGTKVSAMTDKATLVAALTRALERTGAKVTGEAYRG